MKRTPFLGWVWPLPPPAEPGETWRRCETWPRIWASTEGRIARQDKLWLPPRIVRIGLNTHSGRPVWGTRRHADNFIADAFIGPKPKGLELCHRDGDRTNNRAENLRYATRRENYLDSVEHGTAYRLPILHDDDASDILSLMILGENDAATARRFGIRPDHVRDIRNGRKWRHVAPELPRRATWRAMQKAEQKNKKARRTRRHSMQRQRQSAAAAQ